MSKKIPQKLLELKSQDNTFSRTMSKSVVYNGTEYLGFAHCHPDDMDFFSEKVGSTLAHYDALRQVAQDIYEDAVIEYNVLWTTYTNICQTPKYDESALDPTGRFKKAVYRAENRMKQAKAAVKYFTEMRKQYAKNLDYATDSIRRHRSKKAESNQDT